jgi:hypothetical protein
MESFSPWLRDWYLCAKDAIGFSRGFIYAWGPNFKQVSLMVALSGIILDVRITPW